MDEKPKLRVGIFISILMIAVALIYDGAQALIEVLTFGLVGWLINPLINLWSLLTFSTWFYLKGIKFIKPGKALTIGVATIMEFLPFLSDLPTWTAAVTIILAQTYAEDLVAKVSPETLQSLGKTLSRATGGRIKIPQNTEGTENIVNFPTTQKEDVETRQKAA